MASYPTSLPGSDAAVAGLNHGQVYDEVYAGLKEMGPKARLRSRVSVTTNAAGSGFGLTYTSSRAPGTNGTASGDVSNYTLTSAASVGADAYVYLGSEAMGQPWLSTMRAALKFSRTSGIRSFVGFANTASLNVDDPINGGTSAKIYAGIQFSAARDSGLWQFSSNDNTSQVLGSTGISVDTAMHVFEAEFTATQVTLTLDSATVTRSWSNTRPDLFLIAYVASTDGTASALTVRQIVQTNIGSLA